MIINYKKYLKKKNDGSPVDTTIDLINHIQAQKISSKKEFDNLEDLYQLIVVKDFSFQSTCPNTKEPLTCTGVVFTCKALILTI